MVRLSLLGAVEIDGLGESGGGLSTHTRRLALLAFLALKRPGGFVRRDTLLPLFWVDLDQARARKALRQAVYVLRKELAPEVVEGRGDDELRTPSEHLWCDAVAFQEALEDGRPDEALELYRGDLLPGFHLSGAPEFVDWLERERHRLRALAVEAARALTEDAVDGGDLEAAVQWSQRWLGLAPDDEQAVEHAVRLLARAGDRTGALNLYTDFRERLEAEYDLPPSQVLEDLAQAVRDGTLAADPPPPTPSGAAARDAVAEAAGGVPGDPGGARPGWRRWAGPAAAVLVVFLGGIWLVSSWLGTTGPGSGGTTPETTIVAVLPFTVQGDPSFAYLSEGMVDLLSTSLNGAGPLRTVDPATLLAAAERSQPALEAADAAAVARRVGAQLFVLGNVVEAAGRIRVSARLYDERGELQGESEGTAEGEEQVFQLVDLVARDLLASRYGSPELRLRGVAVRTTTSLPALKAYLAAERAFRVDRPEQALAEARRAVTLDPDFALAHYRLSTAAAWMNQPRVALEAARDADATSGALGPRDRLLLDAHLDQQERRFQEAIDGYQAVVAAQPDHVEAWFKLGEALFHTNPVVGRPIGEADAAFARAMELAPDHVQAALHRARLAAIRGDVAALDSMTTVVQTSGAGAESELEVFALGASLRPELEGAVVDAFTANRPAAELNAAIWSRAIFARDIPGAVRLARVALGAVDSPEWQAVYHVRLAYLQLARGRWGEAWDELGLAEALDPSFGLEEKGLVATMPFLPIPGEALDEVRVKLQAWSPRDPPTLLAGRAARAGLRSHLRLYLLGIVQARSGDPASAHATAEALASLPEPEWPEGTAQRWARGVRAFALHQEGRDEEARALLSDEGRGVWGFGNPPIMTQSPERFLWATLEAEAGNPVLAARVFESFAHRRLFHLAFVAPAALERARLAARTGDVSTSRSAYEEFLEAWSGCDEVLEAVRDTGAAELAQMGPGTG